MRRGDTIIVSLGGDFGKPRPAVIVQSNSLIGLDTLLVVPFTTTLSESVSLRPKIEPDATNGLDTVSQAMIDKLTAVRLKRVGAAMDA